MLVAVGGTSPGFIDTFRPETLGAVCNHAQSITVMRVDRFSKPKGVLFLKKVKDLKGTLPRDEVRDFLGAAHEPHEKKHCLQSVKVGQAAVLFRYENRLAICLGDQWHVIDVALPKDKDKPWGGGTRTEPWFLQTYCGPAKDLPAAVQAILDGKEVVIPVMLGKRDDELRRRSGKLIRIRTSLKSKRFNPDRDRVGEPAGK